MSTLYVDQIVAVWFLGVLLAALADENLASRRLVLYAAPIAVIALLKDAGLAFAACGAAILAALVCARLLASERRRSALLKSSSRVAVLLAPMLLVRAGLVVEPRRRRRPARGRVGERYRQRNGRRSGERRFRARRRDRAPPRRGVFRSAAQQLAESRGTSTSSPTAIRALFTDSYRLTTFGLLLGFALWWAIIAYGVLTGESRRKWLIVAGGVLVTALAYIASLHLSLRFVVWGTGARLAVVHPLRARRRTADVRALVLPAAAGIPGRWARSRLAPARMGSAADGPRSTSRPCSRCYAVETPYLRPILQPNPKLRNASELEPVLEQIRTRGRDVATWIYFPRDLPNGFVGRMLQYLLAPTPAVVERSEHFLEGDDTRRYRGGLAPVRLRVDTERAHTRSGDRAGALFRGWDARWPLPRALLDRRRPLPSWRSDEQDQAH